MLSMRTILGAVGGLALAVGSAQADYNIPKAENVFDEVSRGDGQNIVESVCMRCHGAGVMGAQGVGAPGWKHLVEARGFEQLVTNVIRGRGAMPPRGGASISDEEVAAAVLYFLVESDVEVEDIEH